jgi:hypothetical protein
VAVRDVADLDRGPVSAGNFAQWSGRTSAFDAMAAIEWRSFNVTDGDLPERVIGARVTRRYFDVVGVAPILGRTFGDAETKRGTRWSSFSANGCGRADSGATRR